MRRIILLISGFISLGLGIAGIFLPLLPTTPFLLLSAGCFLKSSAYLYNWLMRHRILGTYIKCYHQYKAIPAKTKTISIITLWLTMTVSMIAIGNIWIVTVLALTGAFVTIHIMHFRTLNDEMMEELLE